MVPLNFTFTQNQSIEVYITVAPYLQILDHVPPCPDKLVEGVGEAGCDAQTYQVKGIVLERHISLPE